MHYNPDPLQLEFELSSMCNSLCLGCVRTDNKNFNHTKSMIPHKQMLDLKTFKKILLAKTFGTVEQLRFCGSIDDPLMHPDFYKFIEFAISNNPHYRIHVSTNGGIRNPDYWQKLAQLLSTGRGRSKKVYFCVDGLEDTLGIYRQGVDYNKVIENAKAFMEGGGEAVWRWIEFPWNNHQTEIARQISKDMGFESFHVMVDRSNQADLGYDKIMQRKARNVLSKDFNIGEPVEDLLTEFAQYDGQKIECRSQTTRQYFISYDSKIWPCCFIPAARYRFDWRQREFLKKRFEYYGDENWNDVRYNDVDDILENKFFMHDLEASFENNVSTGPCGKITRCAEVCNLKKLEVKPIGGKVSITEHA